MSLLPVVTDKNDYLFILKYYRGLFLMDTAESFFPQASELLVGAAREKGGGSIENAWQWLVGPDAGGIPLAAAEVRH